MKEDRIKKILVFGNPIVEKDSLPLGIIGELSGKFPGIEFKEYDPNENLEKEGRHLDIIDTVEGIKEAKVITDIDSIITSRLYTMHDFDLGHSLKLLKKLGYIDSVRIFGVPMKISRREAIEQLSRLISATLS